MRWRGGRRSSNIEDRRGQGAGPKVLGGGIGTIVLILVAMYFGVDPTPLTWGSSGDATGERPEIGGSTPEPSLISTVVGPVHDQETPIRGAIEPLEHRPRSPRHQRGRRTRPELSAVFAFGHHLASTARRP